MAKAVPEENPLYKTSESLHELHWEGVVKRNPGEAARGAGATLEGGVFRLKIGTKTVAVDPCARTIFHTDDSDAVLEGQHVSYQRGLVAVSILSLGMEIDPAGKWIAFRELPGGETFFRGPHEVDTKALEEAFGDEPSKLFGAAASLGGDSCEGGDAAAEFFALPRIPLKALIWGKSDEFAASAQLLVDSRAHFHGALDVLWAMSNVVVSDLVRAV